ncbi:MAG TPA: PIN domain-containing protein [Anaeromyxobacteraceae bacterium]|nr:PIN domain-containing protein [Anaeromyxobacteraceae bacterium]
MKRLVLDASAVVAALCSPGRGATLVVLEAARLGLVQIVVCDEAEAEYRRAVEHPRVRRYARLADRQGFVSALCDGGMRVRPSAEPLHVWHSADAVYVQAAIAGGARTVLSFNVRHFLPPPAPNVPAPRHPVRVEVAGVTVMEPRLYLPALREG